MATQIRGSFILSIGCVFYGAFPCFAQVTPETGANGSGTIVTPTTSSSGQTDLIITGGQLSDSKTNLFHSFQDFKVDTGQLVDFDAKPIGGNPAIANIFARVLGGNASYIDGVVRVSNGTSNLFLINPAGILAGFSANISSPGSFTATTAEQIGFSGGLLNALGPVTVAGLEGTPATFQFHSSQSAPIVNEGRIEVGSFVDSISPGQSLRLIGGTVINTGQLSSPSGAVSIVAAAGARAVNIDANGLVSFGSNIGGVPPLLTLQPLLPDLLRSRSAEVQSRSEIKVAATGALTIDGSGLASTPGTALIVRDSITNGGGIRSKIITVDAIDGLNLQGASLVGDRIALTAKGDLTSSGSNIASQGDLSLKSGGALIVNERILSPSLQQESITVGFGNVQLSGNTINIQALALPRSSVSSGQNLTLSSPDAIVGNARLSSGGNFSAGPGAFSQTALGLNGIVSSNGNVSFGDYAGSSLKVEARGSIQAGNIIINKPGSIQLDPSNPDPDLTILNNAPSLVLRAGVSQLRYQPSVPQTILSTTFTDPITLPGFPFTKPGSISVGTITTQSSPILSTTSVLLDASGDIKVGNIDTDNNSISLRAGGDIIAASLSTGVPFNKPYSSLPSTRLTSTGGGIQVETINTGAGGLYVDAKTFFRALGSEDAPIGFTGPAQINDPDLLNYLVSQGFDRSQLVAGGVRINPFSSRIRYSISIRPSGRVNADGFDAPVVIRYGDRSQTLVDRTYTINRNPSRILIQGDSQTPFRLGPNFDGEPPYLPQNSTDRLANYNPTTNNFPFVVAKGRALVYQSPEFPDGASGLVAGIAVGAGIDGSLYSSVQARNFDPPIAPPTPNPGPAPNPNPGPNPSPGPAPGPSQPLITAANQDASNSAQRSNSSTINCPTPLARSVQPIALAPEFSDKPSSSKPSADTRGDDRPLQPQPADPCQKPLQDDTLFKLLYENPNVQGLQELTPADIKQKK
jgi:filamentous hemagglutinin family protein